MRAPVLATGRAFSSQRARAVSEKRKAARARARQQIMQPDQIFLFVAPICRRARFSPIRPSAAYYGGYNVRRQWAHALW